MEQEDIRNGLKLLRLDVENDKKNVVEYEDIFTAYRKFSAYKPEPTIYSDSSANPKKEKERQC
ncbi:MAG: hypothetical protein WCY53_03280 [Sphaerochaetaceae bacterium]